MYVYMHFQIQHQTNLLLWEEGTVCIICMSSAFHFSIYIGGKIKAICSHNMFANNSNHLKKQ